MGFVFDNQIKTSESKEGTQKKKKKHTGVENARPGLEREGVEKDYGISKTHNFGPLCRGFSTQGAREKVLGTIKQSQNIFVGRSVLHCFRLSCQTEKKGARGGRPMVPYNSE